MQPHTPDSPTIFAVASGHGRAAVAIVRISGPNAQAVVTALTHRPPPPARTAVLRVLFDPASNELLDRALILWFPAPHSYTGEDVVELQLHGGVAVIRHVTEAIAHLPGLRPAEPGEFTRRAFEHGRLDLTEAEAIADLINADTAEQRRQALSQMGGALSTLYEGWRQRLIRILAHLEATIDFPEEDLPSDLPTGIRPSIDALLNAIDDHLQDGHRGERLRDGISVAIIGPPNAGKSTLLNALAHREVAIVSPHPGTTRDILEVHIDLSGYPVTIADTAGLRATNCEVEAEGIRRAIRQATDADIKIAVYDGTMWPLRDATADQYLDDRTLIVLTKGDISPPQTPLLTIDGTPILPISAKTGAGMAAFLSALTASVTDKFAARPGPTLTRLRHRSALEACRDALNRALVATLPELSAEDVRMAARALGRITGRVDVEEVLDVIFRDFCIGK